MATARDESFDLAGARQPLLCATVGSIFGGLGMLAGDLFAPARHTCACGLVPLLSVSNALMIAGCTLGCLLVPRRHCAAPRGWWQHLAGTILMVLAMRYLPNPGETPLTRQLVMLGQMFAGHLAGFTLSSLALRYRPRAVRLWATRRAPQLRAR